MRVVADSHALIWYAHDSPRLSPRAADAIDASLDSDGLVVSVITLVELWYVTQTTAGVSVAELDELRRLLATTENVELHPVDVAIADAFTSIDRAVLADPWDRFIVATAIVLDVPLITRDARITESHIIATLW